MKPVPVELYQEAIEEAAEASAWYRQRSERAAIAFSAELDRAMELIRDAPERWPAHLHGTRRFVLRRFPYAVVYRGDADRVEVIAIAHTSRRPGYWQGR